MAVYPRQRINLEFADFGFIIGNLLMKGSTKDDEQDFLRLLRRRFGTENMLLTPSATHSFYRIMGFYNVGSGDRVFLPANVYPSFPEIIRLMGATPVFIEMNKDTLNLDYDDLAKKDISGNIVLVPIHYGILPTDIGKIISLLKEKNSRMIFDSVQYFHPDDLVLKNADAVIYSFGRAKDLDLLGGGAVIAGSSRMKDYISESLKRCTAPSRFSLLADMLKYFYMYFFTSRPVFPVVTYPLLLLNSVIGKDAVGSTPELLFGKKGLDLASLGSARKMCNLQFRLGKRKLRQAEERIRHRRLLGSELHGFVKKNAKNVSVPNISDGIFYTFPIISRAKGLRKRLLFNGIDTHESFLLDCTGKSEELFSKVLHVPIYCFSEAEFSSFRKRFVKSLSNS